jgi:U3 small nucleolar RNA-associated protein 22
MKQTSLEEDGSSSQSERSDAGPGDDSQDEEEEWGGVNEEMDVDTHEHGKPKRPPTGEELREMKDASELFQSSSFKLQVRELTLHYTCDLNPC